MAGRRWIQALISLTLTWGCSSEPAQFPAPPTPNSQEPGLTFTVEGLDLGQQTFGATLSEVDAHWVFDPQSRRTRVHIVGRDGQWRPGIDLVIPLSEPGRYQADTSHRGIDRAFQVTLRKHLSAELVALIAVDAYLDLDSDPNRPDILSGRFSGRFAVGKRSTGRDILMIPPNERSFATIHDGEFRVHYRDTLHGRGQNWQAASPRPAQAAAPATLPTEPEPR